MDDKLFQQTADIALKYGVIKKTADKSAYTSDYAKKAVSGLAGVDVSGANWQPSTVTLTEGGK
jgi:NitT/TauT family transport system substrate-binding protein